MNYETLAPILADIIGFIKSFAEGMKKFINGFKSGYVYGEDEE